LKVEIALRPRSGRTTGVDTRALLAEPTLSSVGAELSASRSDVLKGVP